MSMVVEIWGAWMKGWMGVAGAVLDAQRQSMDRLRRVPQEAVLEPMSAAAEASTKHLEQAREDVEQVVVEAGDAAEETEDEMLQAAGDKPSAGRRRGRASKED